MSGTSTPKQEEQTAADNSPAAPEAASEVASEAGNAQDAQNAKTPTEGTVSGEQTEAGQPNESEAKSGSIEPTYREILRSRPYVIKTSRWSPDGAVEGESILSQTLDKKVFKPGWDYVGDMTLAGLRKIVPGMSRHKALHKFCTASGVVISDEEISFEDYLALESDDADTPEEKADDEDDEATDNDEGKSAKAAHPSGVKSVMIHYRSANTNKVDDMESAPAIDLKLSDWDPEKATVKELRDLKSRINDKDYQVTTKKNSITAGELTEKQWEIVLRNCGVFFGWIIDPRTRQIRRAPKAAFQLRTKDYRIQESAPDFVTKPTPPPASTAKLASADASKPVSTSNAVSGTDLTTKTGSETGNGASEQPKAPHLDQNASSGHGETDTTTNQESHSGERENITKATAFTEPPSGSKVSSPLSGVQQSLGQQTSTSSTMSHLSATQKAASAREEALDVLNRESAEADQQAKLADERARLENERATTTEQKPKSTEIAPESDKSALPAYVSPPMVVTDKTDKGIPNFRVNDESKIEITVCTHSLMESFAQNDFSSQSTEASVSGGFGGITAGVSAGFASSESHEQKKEKKEQTQTMIARYKYPRCDVLFRADDLEPTPDLAALLKEIELTKNINSLRKVHQDYGQLFCQEVTLGGRLLSTRVMKSDTTTSSESKKEEFKVSVGVQVNTPYGGASMKHEEAKGSATSTATSVTNTQEANVFEAVGGDTILANNPPAWAASVADPNLWRIIERDGLSSLIEMLAQMPGYQKVQNWFVQAVPALTKFITLNAGHEVATRLRVLSPTNELCLNNQGDVAYYLGHNSDYDVTPRLNLINREEQYLWIRVDHEVSKILFNPSSYMAPQILGFQNFAVGSAAYGSDYNREFTQVRWNIVAPFAEALVHGTRVIMKTLPWRAPDAPKPGETDKSDPEAHMVVFRNAQGHFVPGMSDRDEYQYWRILKTDGGSPGDHIKAGDSVRLCWSFSDQTTGWRDYQQDVFGRRQTVPPQDQSLDVLYLKVPWPRLEKKGIPTAMIMSHRQETENVIEAMNTLQGRTNYILQDLQLRIDTVENHGRGDADDYLLKDVPQGRDIDHRLVNTKPQNLRTMREERQRRAAMVNNIFFFGITIGT